MPDPISSLSPSEVAALRARFPILGNRTYLNSCSLGALSLEAEAYLGDFLARWHTMGASAWYEHWMGRLDLLRERVADLHGAGPSEVALLPSTSAALTMMAETVPPRGRHRVVCTELDFPTLPYQWLVKPDIEVVMLESHDGVGIDLQQFADAVDERTLFVATSHVFFSTGAVQDIRAIGDIARSAGAWSLIDGYQAPGQIPVRFRESGVDMYTSGPLKWLCGGPGLSYLFVREEHIASLTPHFTSWFAAKDQFAFEVDRFEFRNDARRFEMGTPALPTVHTALGGQEALASVGWDRVFARIRDLTDRLVRGCTDQGLALRIHPDPERRSGIVMVRHPDPAGAVRRLDAMDIVVDHRPGHVRISPHVYNTEDEIDLLVESLAGLYT